jgi:hypothetical protein
MMTALVLLYLGVVLRTAVRELRGPRREPTIRYRD